MAVKALQQWCKIQCEGYRDVCITNMTTSFRDGLAFCALIHKHRPDLIDFDSLCKENVYENNHLAFRVAEEELSIPALLDAEDMVALKVPDRLSILTYVSQYYNYFHGRSPIGGLAGVKRPAEDPVGDVSGKRNQAVTAKTYTTPKNLTETKRDIPVERPDKSSSINRSCSVCNKHVHLVQRHLVDGKLYHRNCFKCSECSNILLSGTYKPGNQANTFICKSHHNTPKAPPTQATPFAHYSQTTPTIANLPLTPKNVPLRSVEKDSNQPKISLWGMSKTGGSPAPTPAFTPASTPVFKPTPTSTPVSKPTSTPTPTSTPVSKPTPTAAPRYKPTASNSVVTTVKILSEPKVLTETPKAPSSSVLRNLEAKQRFFESSSSPSSPGAVSKGSSVTPSSEKPLAGSSGAAQGTSKAFLRVDDWRKEEKKEKENSSEKEKAKSVISIFVAGETSKTSSSSSPSAGLRTNPTINVSPAPAAPKVLNTRLRLKPPEMDLDLSPNPSSTKPTSLVCFGEKSTASKLDTAPSDWRSLLKPVAKNTKSSISQDSTPTSDMKTSNAGSRPWESHVKSSLSPAPASPSTSSSSSTNSSWSSMQDNSATPRPGHGEALKGNNTESSSSQSFPSSAAQTPKLQKPDYIPGDEILKELKEIEMKLNELEHDGVELEKQLRQCEEEEQEDVLTNDLMVDWFSLIRKKQVYIRRESELVYIGRSQELEEEQPNVEAELRKLMETPESLKTSREKKREEELMAKLVEIVNDRNAIVDGLDEDRLREEEEDEQLNKMMQDLDIKKEKKKRSPMSRLFWRKSKHEASENI
ncbi:protein-methionine sulfoxide oxidase mical2b [Silurus meridionalis]|uniref:protein-methionine sulfoxide oxidase mical2b n=1 Tax=Silurus meridionalis TaxID=175797 RepID=UPI001EEBD1BF|nr:protein-methionine sulfoxide oxidase mical2b [Silurus meridionalis]